jgi:hypothetical protein
MTAARKPIEAWIDSVALVGPGLPDWEAARAVLRGERRWQHAPVVATLPPILPPAERRRTSLAVRIALVAAHQAVAGCSFDAAQLASVFTSSGGDGVTCHLICDALAQEDRRISPTHFHNSVHNAPSGYWGIAMRATAASTSLCGHDASFAAGLIDAMMQVAADAGPVLLVAYDAPYPEPLKSYRPVPDAFGLAMVLSPRPTPRSALGISMTIDASQATRLDDPALEALRLAVPTARALPLMQAIARGQPGTVVIEYLEPAAPGLPPPRLVLTLEAPATDRDAIRTAGHAAAGEERR